MAIFKDSMIVVSPELFASSRANSANRLGWTKTEEKSKHDAARVSNRGPGDTEDEPEGEAEDGKPLSAQCAGATGGTSHSSSSALKISLARANSSCVAGIP